MINSRKRKLNIANSKGGKKMTINKLVTIDEPNFYVEDIERIMVGNKLMRFDINGTEVNVIFNGLKKGQEIVGVLIDPNNYEIYAVDVL